MHTRGPWFVSFAHDGPGGWYVHTRHSTRPDKHGIMIADVNDSDRHLLEAPESAEANARLMAASPDLLKALKAVMGGQLSGNVDLDAERFQAARAAIAKAEGK